MAENSMLVVGIIAIVLITAGLTYYVTKASVPAVPPLPNQTNVSGNLPTITVSGEAARAVAPDEVAVGLTVGTLGTDAPDSQAKSATETAKVKAALLAAGVNESEIQTVSYYTYAVYNESCSLCYSQQYYGEGVSGGIAVDAVPPVAPDANQAGSGAAPAGAVSGEAASSGGVAYSDYYPSPVPPYPCRYKDNCNITGYRTIHSIVIKSGKTTEGGKYVEAALGATNSTKVDYVYFSVKDETRIKVEAELQAEAAASAKAKAGNIAKGLGASLGKVVSVNPDNYRVPYPAYAYEASGMTGAAAPPTEIFPTTTQMSSYITVVYELVQ